MKKKYLFLFFSIIAALTVGGIFLTFVRNPNTHSLTNPFQVYYVSFMKTMTSPAQLANIVIRSTPIIMTGLSVSFAYKAGLFNIGVEGQFILGSIVALLTGYMIKLPPFIHPIFALILSGIFGGLLAMFIGFLKIKFKISEVLSSIMLNWIMLYLNNFMVDILQRPDSESSYRILNTARFDFLGIWKTSAAGVLWRKTNNYTLAGKLLSTDLNYSIIIAVIFALLIIFILNKTVLGYEIKAVGLSKDAALYGGVSIQKVFLISMFISGALAGVAGASNVLSRTLEISKLYMMEGNGFNGIAVAFMGMNNPIGVMLSGLFFGLLSQSGIVMQNNFVIPSEIISVILGFILFFIAINSQKED